MSNTEQHPTTTHADRGSGRPRLIFAAGSEDWDGKSISEFALVDEITRIGAASYVDLRLAGLEPLHAEIRHDDQDEYILFAFAAAGVSNDLQPGIVLRTGARVELGQTIMSFARDEYADHGRPFGGRQGGEFAHQQPQPERKSGATSD